MQTLHHCPVPPPVHLEGEGKREEQVCELIQAAREQEHPHQDQDHAPNEREGTRVAADWAQKRTRTIQQETDQQKRYPQTQRVGQQEDHSLQQLRSDSDQDQDCTENGAGTC